MKKLWRKICRHEFLSSFILHGVLIVYCTMTAISALTFFTGDSRLTALFIIVVIAVVLVSVISLYKISAAYIQWYKKILDFIPMPVIITDEKANWQQINYTARKMMKLEPDSEVGALNSKQLIDENGNITKKTATHDGVKYNIISCRLQSGGKDTGFLIVLDNGNRVGTYESRTELITEINRLLGHLGTATDQFHDYASGFVDCTIKQAGIINNLADVITGIASGELREPDALSEKMNAVKLDLEHNVENNQANLEAVIQTVKKLDATRDCIDHTINNIDSVS